jgi:hypothetical protein
MVPNINKLQELQDRLESPRGVVTKENQNDSYPKWPGAAHSLMATFHELKPQLCRWVPLPTLPRALAPQLRLRDDHKSWLRGGARRLRVHVSYSQGVAKMRRHRARSQQLMPHSCNGLTEGGVGNVVPAQAKYPQSQGHIHSHPPPIRTSTTETVAGSECTSTTRVQHPLLLV